MSRVIVLGNLAWGLSMVHNLMFDESRVMEVGHLVKAPTFKLLICYFPLYYHMLYCVLCRVDVMLPLSASPSTIYML